MLNEGHNGLARCVRTRRVGKEVLPAAHAAGCRVLAMEALPNRGPGPSRHLSRPVRSRGHLAQWDLIDLIETALGLGWTLVGYECDPGLAPEELRRDAFSIDHTNWREEQQAHNLAKALEELQDEPMLVWCGNGHHQKRARDEWIPMGARFVETSGINPFCIDQLPTVALAPGGRPTFPVTDELRITLEPFGGSAGFVREEQPAGFTLPDWYDAWIFSLDNEVIGDPSPAHRSPDLEQ